MISGWTPLLSPVAVEIRVAKLTYTETTISSHDGLVIGALKKKERKVRLEKLKRVNQLVSRLSQ